MTQLELKRAANMLIQRNHGFKFPAALLAKLNLNQIQRIMAILAEGDRSTQTATTPSLDEQKHGYSLQVLLASAKGLSDDPKWHLTLHPMWDTELILTTFIEAGYVHATLDAQLGRMGVRLYPGPYDPAP
jgi:hypothetical protein